MKNILVIEDSKPVLEFIKRKIESKGRFKFFGADSFASAQELIQKEGVFAAIVDLELPDAKSGAALDLTLANKIPSIVLTGTMNQELRDVIIQKPIVDYIQKESMDMLDQAISMLYRLDYFKGKKVVILSDNGESTKIIEEQMQRLLFDVSIVDSYEGVALEISTNSAVIVFIDYEDQQKNGAEIVKKLRNSFQDKDLIIFGVGDVGMERAKYRFLKSGATSYLTRPIIKEELVSKIVNNMSFVEQKENLASYISKVDKYVITSITDPNGIIKYASEAFCDISGYTKEELIGKNHHILKHPDMPAKVYADLWATISSKKSWSGEIKNRKKNGDSYWIRANIEPILDSDGDILGYQAIRQDITDKKTIELMSITDELTGLYNRRHFNFKIAEAIKEAKASGSLLTFFMMDVDNFKKYNDTYGHKMGDDVLSSVGKVMKEMLSLEGDIAFRLGGEEFGGIVNAKSFDEAKESVEAVRYMLENLKIEHSKNTASPYITASFGVICCDFSNNKNLDITQDDIYTKADECLYMAKENGRNRLECVLL